MSKKNVTGDFRYERGAGWRLRHDVCSMCGAKRPAAKGFEPAPGAAAFAGIRGLENGIDPHPRVFFVRISIHGSCWLIIRKDIILKDFWMRLSFFRRNWCKAWFFVVREVTVARQSGEGQRDRFYASFGYTSILQDGASTSSTNAVWGDVKLLV
jgi:hypothetical protein